MKRPSWFRSIFRRAHAAPPLLTQCPDCGREMLLVEKTTMTGNDMRTYRCGHCRKEHVVDFGPALWKALSDAREKDGAP